MSSADDRGTWGRLALLRAPTRKTPAESKRSKPKLELRQGSRPSLDAKVTLVPAGDDAVVAVVTERATGRQISRMWVPLREETLADTTPPVGYALAKRALDLLAGGAATLLAAPLFSGLALAIIVDDPGPVLFHQRRSGLRGREFKMLKFRSMTTNADKTKAELRKKNESSAGVIFKLQRDPRVTRVGKFLRRLSLDELPQLFNVVFGDMTLVGPRPHPVEEVATYAPDQRDRLNAEPGITCLWQVMGRSLIPFDEQMKLDRLYIEHRSLELDLRILARTAHAVVSGRGAF